MKTPKFHSEIDWPLGIPLNFDISRLYTDYYVILPKIEKFTRSKPLGRSLVYFGVFIFKWILCKIWGLLYILVRYLDSRWDPKFSFGAIYSHFLWSKSWINELLSQVFAHFFNENLSSTLLSCGWTYIWSISFYPAKERNWAQFW